jgi:hypothetical protein
MLLVILHLLDNVCVPLQTRDRLVRRSAVALTFILVVTAHWKSIFGALEFYLFQACFSFLCGSFALYTGLMWYHADIRLNRRAKDSFARGATLFLAGWVMWLTEQSCCAYIKAHAIPVQLHAVCGKKQCRAHFEKRTPSKSRVQCGTTDLCMDGARQAPREFRVAPFSQIRSPLLRTKHAGPLPPLQSRK